MGQGSPKEPLASPSEAVRRQPCGCVMRTRAVRYRKATATRGGETEGLIRIDRYYARLVHNFRLVHDFDSNSTRGTKIECPGAMQFSRRIHLKSVIFQVPVDLVHPLFALLDEADMKSLGIADLSTFYQVEYEPVLSKQHGKPVVAYFFQACEAKIRFEELSRLRNVSDSKIEMIQFH